MLLHHFYFLSIDQANHATVYIYQIIVRLALPLKGVQVKAPITLREKLLIVYALLRLLKFSWRKLDCTSTLKKNLMAKVALRFYLCIAKVALLLL